MREFLPVSRGEIVENIQNQFAYVRGKTGYHWNDSYWDHVWEELLERPRPKSVRDSVRSAIENAIHRDGDILIMDQGCGHGNALFGITKSLAEQKNDNGRIIGYGVSGMADDAHFGRELAKYGNEKDHFTELQTEFPGDRFFHEMGSHNPILIALERDIHSVTTMVRMKFDLIFSDHAYMHLRYPARALSQAINGLKIGGVAVIGRPNLDLALYSQFRDLNKIATMWQWFMPKLRHMNPGYTFLHSEDPFTIRRDSDAPFRTDLSHVTAASRSDNGEDRIYETMTYIADPVERSHFVSVDESLDVPLNPYRPSRLY